MNKKKLVIFIAIGALILATGVTALVLTLNQNKVANPSSDGTGIQLSSYKIVKACDELTLDEAKTVLGDAATPGSTSTPVENESLYIDTCSYVNNATALADIRIITIMIRSALDGDGQASNTEAFEPGGPTNPEGSEAVSGYGEKAFWDPSTQQLAILKENLWISVMYSNSNLTSGNLEDVKKVADLVLN